MKFSALEEKLTFFYIGGRIKMKADCNIVHICIFHLVNSKLCSSINGISFSNNILQNQEGRGQSTTHIVIDVRHVPGVVMFYFFNLEGFYHTGGRPFILGFNDVALEDSHDAVSIRMIMDL